MKKLADVLMVCVVVINNIIFSCSLFSAILYTEKFDIQKEKLLSFNEDYSVKLYITNRDENSVIVKQNKAIFELMSSSAKASLMVKIETCQSYINDVLVRAC